MYEVQTYNAILSRLKSSIVSNTSEGRLASDTSEGSFIHDVLSPAALELAQLYAQLDSVLNLAFAQTSYGKYLDYRADEHGVTRKPALKAKGDKALGVWGISNTVIAAGSVFVSDGGIEFVTTESGTINQDGNITLSIEAVKAGTEGNLPEWSINTAKVTIPGVTGITNPAAITGGMDEESDTDLLKRLLEVVRQPATSGNAYQYLQWAKSINGVGDAKVFPQENGTVAIFIVNQNRAPASQDIVSNVQNYIDSVRPIGATVSVTPAQEVIINVAATITLDSGYTTDQVKTSFSSILTDYLESISFRETVVSIAKIGSLLLEVPGITDYVVSSLKVNNDITSVTLGSKEVPTLGMVTLS